MEEKNFRIGNIVKKPIKLTTEHLTGFGFMQDENGNYWIDLQTHYLELVPSDGAWHPVYVQVPEMSQEDEQRVSLNRLQHVHELQNLYFVLTGNEFRSRTVWYWLSLPMLEYR
jgi:hypothetical protein